MGYGEIPVRTSLKIYYKLEGNSTDFSGNSNDGADTSVAYSLAYGKFGQGAHFNGTSAYIASESNLGITGAGHWTMNIWTHSNATVAVGNLISIGNAADKNLCGLMTSGTGVGYLFLNFWSGGDNYDWNTGLDFTTGKHSFITTYDGTYVKVYIDGILNVTRTVALNITDAPARIGGRTGGYVGQYTNSDIDEVIIEGRGWSAAEIRKYYTQAIGRFVAQTTM